MRVPTEKQYGVLLSIGNGNAGMSRRKRETDPLLRHGWVVADWHEPFYQWVRITPVGLRALAEAVERYGLPEIVPRPQITRRVCADCGGKMYRFEARDVDPVTGVEIAA